MRFLESVFQIPKPLISFQLRSKRPRAQKAFYCRPDRLLQEGDHHNLPPVIEEAIAEVTRIVKELPSATRTTIEVLEVDD
jgi:hypothetical protein